MKFEIEDENKLDISKAKSYSKWDEVKRWIPSVILLPIAVYWCINRGNYGMIDNADLVIHEAGHIFSFCLGSSSTLLGEH